MTRQQGLIEQKLKAQAAIQAFKKSDAYELLITPVEAALEKLKYSYECKTLQEMAELKGQHRGLTFIPDLIAIYEKDGTIAQEKILKQQKIESQVIDSTDL